MDYQKDIEEDVKDFIANQEEMIKEAIIEGSDWDLNDIRGLDEAFHEDITDRVYTPEDAVYILENCENEESDSGIWEGLNNWRDELSARAAYSYSNDVWFALEEQYNELKEEFDRQWSEVPEPSQNAEEDWEEKAKESIASQIIKDYLNQFRIDPITDRKEQIRLIERYIELGKGASWWEGYPVGGSYIDSRCGTGHGMPDIKDYVDFDHEIAHKIPAISGKYKPDVLNYLKKIKKMRCKEVSKDI